MTTEPITVTTTKPDETGTYFESGGGLDEG